MGNGDKYYGTGVVDAVDDADPLNMAEAILVEASLAYARAAASNAALITNSTTQFTAGLDLVNDAAIIAASDNVSSENDEIIASLKIVEDAAVSADTEVAGKTAYAEVAKIVTHIKAILNNHDDVTGAPTISTLGTC